MKSIFRKVFTPVAALILVFSSHQAMAIEYPTFTIDAAASSVDVNHAACWPRCGATPQINPGLEDVSFKLTESGVGSRHQVRQFVTWSATGSSIGAYDVTANIVFSSPNITSASINGGALLLNMTGRFIAGLVHWDRNWTSIVFDQGSEIKVRLSGLTPFRRGTMFGSTLLVRAVNLAPMNTPSPVPLPASFPMMALLIAGGAYVARRRANGATQTA